MKPVQKRGRVVYNQQGHISGTAQAFWNSHVPHVSYEVTGPQVWVSTLALGQILFYLTIPSFWDRNVLPYANLS